MKSTVSEAISFMLSITKHIRSGDIRACILCILIELNFNTNSDGFFYLRDVVAMKVEHPNMRYQDICTELAAVYGNSYSFHQMDQAIRMIITKAWAESDHEKWLLLLPQIRNKRPTRPSNNVFVSQLACMIELWSSGVMQNVAE